MTAEAEKNSQIHKSSKSSSEKKYSMNNFHKSSSLKCSSPVVGHPTTGVIPPQGEETLDLFTSSTLKTLLHEKH